MDRRTVLTFGAGAVAFFVVIVAVWTTMLFMKPTAAVMAPPVPPTPARPAPAVVKKPVAKPAPSASAPAPVTQVPEMVINIYSPASQPAPVAQQPPTPAPPVTAPPPAPLAPPVSVYPPPTPPPPPVQPQVQPQAQPPVSPAPRTTVNILSGNSLQLRVEVFSRWGGTYGGPSYGLSYGPTRWMPGFQRWVCEGPPPPAGPGCYYKWEPAHYE